MKYELTENTKNGLYQIRSLKSFGNVKAGDLGGYIEKKSNLSQDFEAWVDGYALVDGDARVSGNARVDSDALVSGNALVDGDAWVRFGKRTNNTIFSDIESQTGLKSINNEVFCYKHVRDDLTSLYDKGFKYIVGEYAEAINPDISSESCASGLHVSNAQYWNGNNGGKIIFCKVRIDDIITVQRGKIRCKRLFVIGVCDGDVF